MSRRSRRVRGSVSSLKIAAALVVLSPMAAMGVDWNGTDPGSSAISANGLTDNYGQLTDESVIFNNAISARGTCTDIGNGWVLTAQHVVQGTGGYGTLAPASQIQVNIYGTYYTADAYQGFGSSDIMLVHLAGANSGTITNLIGVERSQIYTGSSETGNLEQLGGFGYYGQLNSGTNGTNISFHRGFNIANASGGFINVSANGSSRLVQDGYVLGYQQSGDSGSGLWMDNGPDQDLDLHDWSLIGVLDTGTTPGYFGDGGQYARVSSYAGTIINTVFPNAWLTWNANTGSTAASDGAGTWDLATAHFTDGTNYAFNGPERTQIATFGAGNGAAGVVTLGANIPVDRIVFNAAGSGSYTIAGGAGTSLMLSSDSAITTNVNATISATITGGSSSQQGYSGFPSFWRFTKNGGATLTLTGTTMLDSGVAFYARGGTTVIDSGGVFDARFYTSVAEYSNDSATLTVKGSGVFSGAANDFNLGDLGGNGTLEVQDTASLSVGNMYVGKGSAGLTGAGAIGTVNQNGGTVTASSVSLATNHPGSVGTYNLNGGSLSTASITGGLGTSNFNFNGGQIVATGNSTSLMQNLTSAAINGGATINTNGYNVTLNQPLSHSSAAPTTDGGLTKSGAGTLTLGGASSYTGPTVINAGTVTLNPASGSAAVAIQPVASYSFDNVSGSTVVNGGTGGTAMNGTLTGNATIVPGGRFGNAVSLSGGGAVVVNNPITDTGGAADWTISAWVHTTTPGAAIMDKSNGSGWTWDNSVFYLGGGNGPGSGGVPSAVRYGRGFYQAASSTPSVDDGSWHLVIYVDAAGTYSIYTDGKAVALSSGNSGFEQAVEQGSVVSFGITTDNVAGDGTANFNGMLDEIQIYNRPLTAAQIMGLYTSDSPNPGPGSSVLPSSSAVTVASGATLNINGLSQTIGSLSGPVGGVVQLGSGQLTVSSSATTSFAGGISGAGGVLTKSGSGTQTLDGADTYTGGTTVNAGTLVFGGNGALPTGPVNIAGGTLQLGASTGLATITSLSITGTGTFDVNNNHIIINYGSGPGPDPIASIAALLTTGFNGGAWNGAGGITSIAAAANSSSYALGYADSTDPGNPAGLSSGTIEIAYTLLGDADLNGVVNGIDFGILAANFNKSVSRWDQGDFNYDNIVNGIDFAALAANFNKGASGASGLSDPAVVAFAVANGLMADVPEPASTGVLAAGAVATLWRRRRRSSRSPAKFSF